MWIEAPVCNAELMRKTAVLLLLGIVIGGCGGKSTASSAAAGCAGLHTTHGGTFTLLTVNGTSKLLTRAFVCAHFGAPTTLKRYKDGRVAWFYGSAILVFKGNDAVEGAGFNR
jgi:hypothetical protein